MRKFCLLFGAFLVTAGCSHHPFDEHYYASSVRRYASGNWAVALSALVVRIEHGDSGAWREFASYADKVSGETAETYDVACSELARRDPTFYLRRYLAGDLVAAVRCGRKAYGWSGTRGRSLLDAIYAERLYVADDTQERERIHAFILATAQWKTP